MIEKINKQHPTLASAEKASPLHNCFTFLLNEVKLFSIEKNNAIKNLFLLTVV